MRGMKSAHYALHSYVTHIFKKVMTQNMLILIIKRLFRSVVIRVDSCTMISRYVTICQIYALYVNGQQMRDMGYVILALHYYITHIYDKI